MPESKSPLYKLSKAIYSKMKKMGYIITACNESVWYSKDGEYTLLYVAAKGMKLEMECPMFCDSGNCLRAFQEFLSENNKVVLNRAQIGKTITWQFLVGKPGLVLAGQPDRLTWEIHFSSRAFTDDEALFGLLLQYLEIPMPAQMKGLHLVKKEEDKN